MTMLVRGKPLIENAMTPEQMFTERDLELIKAALGRMYVREKHGREAKVEATEVLKVGALLQLARQNGYYPRGVNKHGGIRWVCLSHPKSRKLQTSRVSLMTCNKCGRRYQEAYYPEKEPERHCPACRVKADRDFRRPQLREMP